MYDNLVITLRNNADHYMTVEGEAGLVHLLTDAADAIENTSKAYQMMAEAYEAEVTKQEWIPVTERLPEEPYGCLLIVWDSNPMGGDDFLNYLPYFAGWDGEQWNDGDGMQVPFEVVYWMPLLPLPEPPKEETE